MPRYTHPKPRPYALNRCGICSHVIDGGYVKHHGRHCHWSCWAGTNEQPDILALEGDYAEVA